MPHNMHITAYGHCYYVLIVSFLAKSGIQKTDDSINTCFNFLEKLAFEVYQKDSKFDFETFIDNYKKRLYPISSDRIRPFS